MYYYSQYLYDLFSQIKFQYEILYKKIFLINKLQMNYLSDYIYYIFELIKKYIYFDFFNVSK